VTVHDTVATALRIGALEFAAKAARVLRPRAPVAGEPWLVRTPVGIKYVGRGFDSGQFERYAPRTTAPPDSFSWDDLLLPPDLLRDEFTHCGEPITHSPHFRLMQEMREGRPDAGSEYIRLCASGTLDARRAFAVDVAALSREFRAREEAFAARGETDVYVFGARRRGGRDVYVIADGKHRAAQAALSGDLRALRLRVVSDDVLAHPFFRKIYDAVMAGSDESFSANRRMVRLLRHE
jgi:hypothetical protein